MSACLCSASTIFGSVSLSSSAVISCASARQRFVVSLSLQRFERCRRALAEVDVALGDHQPDHSREAHLLAVLGREDARNTVVVQVLDLARHDDAAAAAVDADVRAAALTQQVEHVPEELDVPALVARHRDALHVFLHGRGHDLLDRAVVAEVDDLGAHALQDAPHDVDAGVMAVEKRRRGDEPDLVLRAVAGELLDFRQVGHARSSPARSAAGGRIILAGRCRRQYGEELTLADVDVNVNYLTRRIAARFLRGGAARSPAMNRSINCGATAFRSKLLGACTQSRISPPMSA